MVFDSSQQQASTYGNISNDYVLATVDYSVNDARGKLNRLNVFINNLNRIEPNLRYTFKSNYKRMGGSSLSNILSPYSASHSSGLVPSFHPSAPKAVNISGSPNIINLLPFKWSSGSNVVNIQNDNGGDYQKELLSGSGYPGDLGKNRDRGSIRGVGMRLPMMGVGWGYDLDDNPAPSGNSGKFAGDVDNGYEVDPQEYIAAPIDLRYDRNRGVWTSNARFVGFAQITGWNTSVGGTQGWSNAITYNAQEVEIVINSGTPGDTSGLAFSIKEDGKVWGENEPYGVLYEYTGWGPPLGHRGDADPNYYPGYIVKIYWDDHSSVYYFEWEDDTTHIVSDIANTGDKHLFIEPLGTSSNWQLVDEGATTISTDNSASGLVEDGYFWVAYHARPFSSISGSYVSPSTAIEPDGESTNTVGVKQTPIEGGTRYELYPREVDDKGHVTGLTSTTNSDDSPYIIDVPNSGIAGNDRLVASQSGQNPDFLGNVLKSPSGWLDVQTDGANVNIFHVGPQSQSQTYKTDGLEIDVDARGHVVDFIGTSSGTFKSKVSQNDSVPDFLINKLTSSDASVDISELNDSGDELVNFTVSSASGDKFVKVTSGDTQSDYLDAKLTTPDHWLYKTVVGVDQDLEIRHNAAASGTSIFDQLVGSFVAGDGTLGPSGVDVSFDITYGNLKTDTNGHVDEATFSGGASPDSVYLSGQSGVLIQRSGNTAEIKIAFESTPSDGDLFIWNDTNGTFEPTTIEDELKTVSGYNSNNTQYLRNSTGTLEWVDTASC